MAFTPFVETDRPTMANFNEKFQECIQAAIDGGIQIESGRYMGTGKYGANNPNILTFNFVPYFVAVLGNNNSLAGVTRQVIMVRSANRAHTIASGYSQSYGHSADIVVNWNENSVEWYSTSNAVYQQNYSNHYNYYIAIGKGESA